MRGDHPRRRGRLRRRRDRRLPRPRAGAEARGPGARGGDPDRVRRLDRPLHVPVRRRRRRAGVDRRAAHDHLDRRRHEHGQLPRRPGRPRRRRLRDLGHDLRRDRALAREGRRRRPLGRRRRRVRRLPAPQLLPGADLHGRLGRARARLHARHGLGRRAPEDGLDRRPLPAAARARGADHRHVVRGAEAAQVPAADLDRRPLPPAPPLHQHRLQPAACRGHDVGVDGVPRGRGARDALRPLPRGRPLASVGDGRRRRDRARRARLLGLHRLPARDRQAREPAHPPPPRGAGSRRRSGVRPEVARLDVVRSGFSRTPGSPPAERTPPAPR